jgi:hypothetical protein
VNEELKAAVDEAVFAELPPEQREAAAKECKVVAKLWKEYEDARAFDEGARKQYAIDRRYAAGTADLRWAVSTNLIGSFIDILVSFLYARNPDVSVRKSPQVDSRGTRTQDDFAKTMELVISSLWKRGRLKFAAREQVRSTLSVGPGWLKVIMVADGKNIPEMQKDLGDLRDNLQRLEESKAKLQSQWDEAPMIDPLDAPETPLAGQMMDAEAALPTPDYSGCDMTPEEYDCEEARLNELVRSTQEKIEVSVRKSLAIDFLSAEDVQMSLNIRKLNGYRDADWIANAIYVLKSEVKEKFPRLMEAEVKSATGYFQRKDTKIDPIGMDLLAVGQGLTPADAEQYSTSKVGSSMTVNGGNGDGAEFVKVVELWDKRTNHVKTMIEGVKRWAKEPYQPDYPTSRFFPYFLLTFYDVDGARHPQSLAWRLCKLQDEYATCRSAQRLTRERSIPGIMFNETQVGPEEATKLKNAQHQEFIGMRLTDPTQPLQNAFAEKPVAKVDQRLFDTQSILQDMEKIAGVQEALQSSTTPEKTATEAEIQQTGFASRTTADRDTLETELTDLAEYTAELALGSMSLRDVQRIAGAAAFWPENMDVEDLLTMVELDIVAGTTGKPKAMGDRETWGVVLPMIKETIVQIQQAIMAGNEPLAKALIELMRETMIRLGDDTDIERFIPDVPEPAVDPVTGLPLPPGVPGAPGAAPSVGPDPSLPPQPAPPGGGAPSDLQVPEVVPPEILPPTQ